MAAYRARLEFSVSRVEPASPDHQMSHDPSLRPQSFGPTSSLMAAAPPLPVPTTTFVGRESETKASLTLLRRDDVRLLTLTGPGSFGKSRLALRVVNEIAADFPDGVWFVPLATITDPTLVIATIAQTVGIPPRDDRWAIAQIATWCRGRRPLLLHDNFEQVVDASIDLAALLTIAPDLKLLVTSRERLNLTSESAARTAIPTAWRWRSPVSLRSLSSGASRTVPPGFSPKNGRCWKPSAFAFASRTRSLAPLECRATHRSDPGREVARGRDRDPG